MDHKINIKFGEVNNLSDARYAAALGATFLGFNLSPAHPQYVSPDLLKEISGWAAGPTLVTEWEDEIKDIIADTCTRLGIEYVQLNRFNPEMAQALRHDFCVIQNITIKNNDQPHDIIAQIDAVHGCVLHYMLSFEHQEAQDNFLAKESNKLMLLDFCRNQPVIFNFNFTPQNLLPVLNEFNPFGINLKGSSEIKPGYKDFDDLNELVSLLENEG